MVAFHGGNLYYFACYVQFLHVSPPVIETPPLKQYQDVSFAIQMPDKKTPVLYSLTSQLQLSSNRMRAFDNTLDISDLCAPAFIYTAPPTLPGIPLANSNPANP